MKDLKAQADKLGVKYSANIGKDTLQARVREAIIEASERKVETPKKRANVLSEREVLKNAALRLVRVRITCMDPKQKDKRGTTYQVSNNLVGTVGKHVEFNVPTHVPQILLNIFIEKEFQTFIAGESRFGITQKTPKQVKTYAIEYLDALTPTELDALKTKQAIANNIEDVI